jgi:hypothetical protein
MIGSAIERGSLICAFDEHGMTLFSKAKGSGPNDGLLGFSGSTVTVRFDHLHVRREGHDAVLEGGMTDCIIPDGLSRRRCA